jgi:hypothetical protein
MIGALVSVTLARPVRGPFFLLCRRLLARGSGAQKNGTRKSQPPQRFVNRATAPTEKWNKKSINFSGRYVVRQSGDHLARQIDGVVHI